MTISDEQYAAVAVEIAKSLVGVVNFDTLAVAGFDRVTNDIFDLTDAFCAELAVRLAKRKEPAT